MKRRRIAQGFSLEFDLVSVVDKPVEDGISEGRLTEIPMPAWEW
jgi:hypothetical protein